MKSSYIKYSSILVILFIFSCSQDQKTQYVKLKVPQHFPEVPDSPDRNPLTKEGILLGKKLFYDINLSSTRKISCASCHIQSMSFADGQALSSFGASGQKLKRNSPALINLAWMPQYFWDGGVKNLESLPFAALTNPDEMGADLKMIIKYLQGNTEYQQLFRQTFGTDSIVSAHVARALAQFQRTLISADSKYDRVVLGKEQFSDAERKGKQLFENNCSRCHTPPLFTDNFYHNNGLDSIFPSANEDVRAGRYRITLDSADLGKFKTPTLRNWRFTGPYMHDGRFQNMSEILDHYSGNIIKSTTLDSTLFDINFSDADKKAILSFMETLNDENFNIDPYFSPTRSE